MIGLAVKTAAAVLSLWALAFLLLDARQRRADGTSRQYINRLADESRKKPAPARRAYRYSKAGVSL